VNGLLYKDSKEFVEKYTILFNDEDLKSKITEKSFEDVNKFNN